jgi:hypothetical protein
MPICRASGCSLTTAAWATAVEKTKKASNDVRIMVSGRLAGLLAVSENLGLGRNILTYIDFQV